MVEAWRIVVNLVSLAINVGLIYFAVRLLLVFKGGKMGKPWLYISSGVLALAISSCLFAFYYIFDLPAIVHPIGGVVMMVGGALILVGLHIQYRSWAPGS
jgi:hypothetical protein